MTKRRWLPRKLSAYFRDRLRRPRSRERQAEKEAREIFDQVQDGTMGLVSEEEIDAIFADLDTPRGYEIWDVYSANMVWDCDTEEKALAFVREQLSGSPEYQEVVKCWGLVRVEADGETTKIAEADHLIRLAREETP